MNPFNLFAQPLPPDHPEHPDGHVSVENINGACIVKIFDTAKRERLVIHVFMDWQTAEILAGRILQLVPEEEWPTEL